MSLLKLQKPVPFFKGTAVVDGFFKEISLDDYKNQYIVLLFYSLDFISLNPTEIIAFSNRYPEFKKIETAVIAVSTDSHFCHLAWINTPKKEGGLGPMNITLLSDKSMKIARDYGVLDEETGIAFRALFIIDDHGMLRQMAVHDFPVGRSVDETLRLVQAFKFTDKYSKICSSSASSDKKPVESEDGTSDLSKEK